MARTNAGLAERSVFARMFNWRYYDRADESEHSLLWLIDTRFHEHFNEIVERLDRASDPVPAYKDLGRILSYLQLVTSPAHVVPVYTARFWRLSFSDRFDNYPLDEEKLVAVLGDDCEFLQAEPRDYTEILTASAGDTLKAVVRPIPGLPTTWEAFWYMAKDERNFGSYGPAGNSFGKRTEFRCGDRERCVLLNDDPLYVEFARARHLQAVRGTLAAMKLMQTSTREVIASAE